MATTLPQPTLLYGINHIPAPSVSSFDAQFGSLLPSGTSITSSWGTTRFYQFAPDSSPSSRRIVLIHGGGTPNLGLAPLASKLAAAGNHVVTYDLWAHGLSSTPLEAHTPALMHAQLLELLAYLGWSRVHILGFSMGGSIAATFTARHSEVVQSLTLVSAGGLWRRAERGWLDGLIIDGSWGLEWLGRPRILEYIEGNPVPKPDWKERWMNGETDKAAVVKWQREEHVGHVPGVVSMWRHLLYDQHAEFGKLVESAVKVLVILGERDSVIEAEASKRELEALGWKEKICIVDGATHEIVRSHAQEVADLACGLWESLGECS